MKASERYFDPNNLKYFSLCVDAAWVWLQTFQLWNVQVNVALWAALAVAASRTHWAVLVLHPAIVFALDLLERFLGLTIYKREDSTAIAYNRVRFVCANPYGGGIDLGFNFYNGDYTKEARRAQLDKFEHAWAKLGLKEGMRVLDCGCGMGDWMHWLRDEKKCTVVGVNVTLAHALVVRGRGMRCIHSDWQTLFRDDAQFDELRGQVGAQYDGMPRNSAPRNSAPNCLTPHPPHVSSSTPSPSGTRSSTTARRARSRWPTAACAPTGRRSRRAATKRARRTKRTASRCTA